MASLLRLKAAAAGAFSRTNDVSHR